MARKRLVYEDNKCIANLKIIGTGALAAEYAELLNRSDSGQLFHGGLKSLLNLIYLRTTLVCIATNAFFLQVSISSY